jgi:pimeloyl-ACP methyl ester carboxylesterase
MKMLFVISALSALLAMAAIQKAHAGADEAVTCERATVHVALLGQPAKYIVKGELCATEDERFSGTTVQLLVHGATYNHDYWDFGTVDGVGYSYARDAAAHGFPTFSFDLLGSGDSSHPPSNQMTLTAAAHVVHQIVAGLRSGSIAGIRFGKVITFGHSLGSTIVWQEAITYADVDGVIVTGAAHALSNRFIALIPSFLHPAVDDPKFAGSGLDPGYLTSVPGIRATVFYAPPDADPAVVTADEARKDVVPQTLLATGTSIVTNTATRAILVPVLTILGSNDLTTCGPNPQGTFDCSSGAAVATQDAPFYSPRARLHACVVPDSGHDLSLAVNHRLQVADAVAWSLSFVGQSHFDDMRDIDDADQGEEGLPWNDGLPWNCGGSSAASQ